MADLTPDQIASRSFSTSFRGFDVEEVRAFLREVADAVDRLAAEQRRLSERVRELGDRDLQAEFETVGREVAEVLEAARVAAEGMRERAAADAARWRSESLAEAEEERRRARSDAEQLRSDAWATGTELLAQAQREAARIVDEAEKEALRRLGEGEREAHRVLTSSRREAEELLRTTRMEAEQMVMEATSRHDEIIQVAQRQAESAQERTRALEQRRDELKRELDSVRAALAKMEGELDERRERLGLSSHTPEDVDRPEQGPGWSRGETVRVVRSNAPTPVPEPRLESRELRAEDLDPEIRVIPAEELSRRREAESRARSGEEAAPSEPPPEPEAVPEPEPEPEMEEMLPEPPVPELEEPEEPEPPPAPEPEVDESGEQASFEELAGLFERLRGPELERAEEPAAAADEPPPAAPPEPARERVPAGESSEPMSLPVDPFELRDRLLLPIVNRALRNLKRQLTEEQNVALEELRLDESGWEPDAESVRERLQPDVVVLVSESFGAGHAAAEEELGERVHRPFGPRTGAAAVLAADLARELSHVLAEGRAAGQGSRQLSVGVSRVFRGWRTDEIERRVRDLASEGFHLGLSASLGEAGVGAVGWKVAGRGCATCRAAAEEEPPSGLPPAHPGCGCTLVPLLARAV